MEARVNPDKFMLKRLTQKYSDAEINAFIAAKKHVTNITGATKDSFGKVVGKEGFPSNNYSRVLPVKSLPKGTLLFTYFAATVPPEDYSPEEKAKHSFSELVGNSIMPCTYNKETNSYTLTYCKYNFMGNYYYPVPCAGFGILTYDTNTAVACLTSRDADVAYLKTGGSPLIGQVPTKMDMATAANYEWVDFDFKRVQRCDHIETGGKCNDANNYDICLNPEFMRKESLAGYQAIAYPDRLAEMKQINVGGEGRFGFDKNLMGRRYQTWLENVVSHGNQESDLFLNHMNMLCLETDISYAYDAIFPAFPEYFLYTFGENDPVQLMNSLPDDPIIVGKNAVETEGDLIVKLEVTVGAADIHQFLETHIFPYTITRPFNMFNSNGSGLADSLPVLLAEKPPLFKQNNRPTNNAVKNREQQRGEYEYLVNHNIAEAIYNMRSALVYDLTKNLILVIDEAASERAKPMLRGRITADVRQDQGPFPIGFYDILLKDIAAAERALIIKGHHEMLSDASIAVYDKLFMHEYLITNHETRELYHVPIGPFFNHYSKGFSNPIGLCNKPTIDFMNTLMYASGSTEEEALANPIVKISAAILAHFFIKYTVFQKIFRTIYDVTGLPSPSLLGHFNGLNTLKYSTMLKYLHDNSANQGPKSKYFITKYTQAIPNSNVLTEKVLYASPFYHGKWRWSFNDVLSTDEVISAPFGLPVGLSLVPSMLPNSPAPVNATSQAFINQLLRGTKGGRHNTRRNNRIKNRGKRNLKNTRKNNNMNTRKNNSMNLLDIDTLVKPTVITNAYSTKDVIYLQAIKPGAVIAHNNMVKSGLLDNFFVKLSGRPLNYKTAN